MTKSLVYPISLYFRFRSAAHTRHHGTALSPWTGSNRSAFASGPQCSFNSRPQRTARMRRFTNATRHRARCAGSPIVHLPPGFAVLQHLAGLKNLQRCVGAFRTCFWRLHSDLSPSAGAACPRPLKTRLIQLGAAALRVTYRSPFSRLEGAVLRGDFHSSVKSELVLRMRLKAVAELGCGALRRCATGSAAARPPSREMVPYRAVRYSTAQPEMGCRALLALALAYALSSRDGGKRA